MAKKLIYLIRHGETAFNKKGAVQGRGIDASLNETGKRQAQAFYEKYRDVPFQKVYLSTLRRTYETAQGFIEAGVPYEQLAGLDEISWGKVEGLTLAETGYELFRTLLESWQEGDTHAAIEGGESPEQVAQRQAQAMQYMMSKKEEEVILITMHGRAMRIMLSWLLKHPLKDMDHFEHSNTCLYLLEYDDQTGAYTVLQSNDTSHLHGLQEMAKEA